MDWNKEWLSEDLTLCFARNCSRVMSMFGRTWNNGCEHICASPKAEAARRLPGISQSRALQQVWIVQSAHLRRMDESACLEVKNIGKPCAGKLHARFDEGRLATRMTCLTRSSRVRRGVKRSHRETMEPASYSTSPFTWVLDNKTNYFKMLNCKRHISTCKKT
jgi:hypothetical protein